MGWGRTCLTERVDEISWSFKPGWTPLAGACFIIVYLELKTHGPEGNPKYPGQSDFLCINSFSVSFLDCSFVGFYVR
jgi:hypothetical protein